MEEPAECWEELWAVHEGVGKQGKQDRETRSRVKHMLGVLQVAEVSHSDTDLDPAEAGRMASAALHTLHMLSSGPPSPRA